MNSSYHSQRVNTEETIDIMSLISDVDSASIDLIGQQQHSQIDSLKIQVQSLENELASRNEESLLIKKRISQTSITINQIVQTLLNSVDKEEKEKINLLKKIKNEKNSYNKIDQYISFIHNYTQSNIQSFNRVCDQLREHIHLIELLNSETNLPLSLSSQPNYQQIFLNEAQKTNEFLKNVTKGIYAQNTISPPITEILNISNFSPEARYEKVQTMIYGFDIPIEELKTLLLQEISITDVLRKYISANFSEKANEAKLRPRIEAELKKQIEGQLRTEIKNQFEGQLRAEITKNLTEKVRSETEYELKSKIEQELRFKIESEQQQQLERLENNRKWQEKQHAQQIQELESEIERLKRSSKDDLINEISNEPESNLRKKVISLIRGDIEYEIRSQIEKENQLKAKNDSENNQYTNNNYSNYQNSYQNYQQSLLNIQNQQKQEFDDRLKKSLEMKEKELRSQFEIELQQKERQIKAQLESQIRSEIMLQISQNNNRKYLNYHIEKVYSNTIESPFKKLTQTQPVSEQYLNNIYNSLCTARGVIPSTFQSGVNYRKSEVFEYHSNQLLMAILDHASSLASDVSELRIHLFGQKQGRLNFLSRFEELEAEVAHLDQLHTQTRALLIKQSQTIADLRVKNASSSWISWARNLYKVLNTDSEGVDSDNDEEVDFKSGVVNVLDPNYVAELKLAIEEKAVSVMAKEKMRFLRKKT